MSIGRVLKVLAVAWLTTFSSLATAHDRLALVIGIDAYDELTPLQKAKADASAVSATLKSLGFSVELALDANRRSLNRSISAFLGKITPGATVYIHYSGHGVELDNDTFLLPSDMPLPRAADREFVKTEGIRLSGLLDSLKASPAASRVLSIDACRDNPFAQKGTRSLGSARGLAIIPAPKGTLIMYSAAQGQAALDRLGPGDTETASVYTRVLIKNLARPGLSITDVAQEVRGQVEALAASVGHEQRPAYYDELSDRLFLSGSPSKIQVSSTDSGSLADTPIRKNTIVPEAPSIALSTPPPATQFPGPIAPSVERIDWDAVKDTTSVAILKSFLRKYTQGFYADLASARVRELESQSRVASLPPAASIERRVERREPDLRSSDVPAATSGNWLLVLGSYRPDERGKANERVSELRRNGITARIVATKQFSNLRSGLLAVVIGPMSRGSADRELGRAKQVTADAYIKAAN